MTHSLFAILLVTSGFMQAPVTDAVTMEVTATQKVEVAARQYRIGMYAMFRGQRSQYNQRMERGEEVLQAWTEAGHPEPFALEVTQWFASASDTKVLPELPSCFTELRRLAQERATSENGATAVAPAGKRYQVVHTPSAATPNTVDSETASAETAAPIATKTTVTETANFLEDLGKSILRATINASDESDTERFD